MCGGRGRAKTDNETPKKNDVPQFIRDYVAWGAGPRATQYLVLGAKARAALQGRFHAGLDDVRAVALPVLRHRLVTNFNAEAEGIKPDELIRRLIDDGGRGGFWRRGKIAAGVSEGREKGEGSGERDDCQHNCGGGLARPLVAGDPRPFGF